MQPYNNYPQNGQPHYYYPQGTQQYQQCPPYSQNMQQWPNQDLLIQALTPDYTGKAIAVFILYLFGYLPGLICNIIFLVSASSMKKQFGQAPRGMSLLIILLILGIVVVPLFALCIGTTMTQTLIGQ